MGTVYAITNMLSGTTYVGSTGQRIETRWSQHRCDLRQGRHGNKHLLNAWRKHGEDVFIFSILESVPDTVDLYDREEWWCQHFRQIGVRLYNQRPIARSQLGMKRSPDAIKKVADANRGRKRSLISRERMRIVMAGITPTAAIAAHTFEWDIASPDGELLHIKNLNQFCKEHGLDVSHMRQVALGKRPVYKGWTPPTDTPKPFAGKVRSVGERHILIAPDGTQHETTNLEAFCREHDLTAQLMRDVCKGVYHHHKGWTGHREGITPKPRMVRTTRTWPLFIAPDGVVHEIANMYAFCKQHGLSKSAMIRVANGEARSHKGWHLK